MERPEESQGIGWLQRIRRDRDEEAFARLYDAYAPRLYRVCRLILRREAEAQEALQDAFLHVWERTDTFDPARGRLYTWLCLVTRSKAIDRLRRTARLERRLVSVGAGPAGPEGFDAPDPAAPDPLEESVQRARGRAVRRLLARLPRRDAELLALAHERGLSHSEIARHLGRPLGTVKTQLRSATRRLAALTPPEMRAWL